MEKEKYGYCHNVFYIFKSGYGSMRVYNNLKKYETRTQLDNLKNFVISKSDLKGVSIVSILTLVNK